MAINRIPRRYNNPALRDALLKTNTGKSLVVELKQSKREIRTRTEELFRVVHDSLVTAEHNSSYRSYQFGIYKDSQPLLRKIAIEGGDRYRNLIFNTKFIWTNKNTYQSVIKELTV